MHFRYGRAHAKMVQKYGLFQKIHFVPLILLFLIGLELFLLLDRPTLGIVLLLFCFESPLLLFLRTKKNFLKSLKYTGMLLVTIASWTAGFVIGFADTSIWRE
jgi:hypothetical protein